jgi:hypothetical protein
MQPVAFCFFDQPSQQVELAPGQLVIENDQAMRQQRFQGLNLCQLF